MTTNVINPGDTIHCNKCNKAFAAPKEMHYGKFYGQSAARIADEFSTCPHCDHTDVNWVFVSDVAPAIEVPAYIEDKNRADYIYRKQQKWAREN